MAVVKSNILKQLSKNYPNFLKKDLEKFVNIIFDEIKSTLKRGERVEIRGFGVFSTNTQKLEFHVILKQERKLILQKKSQYTLSMLKICLKN